MEHTAPYPPRKADHPIMGRHTGGFQGKKRRVEDSHVESAGIEAARPAACPASPVKTRTAWIAERTKTKDNGLEPRNSRNTRKKERRYGFEMRVSCIASRCVNGMYRGAHEN